MVDSGIRCIVKIKANLDNKLSIEEHNFPQTKGLAEKRFDNSN